MGYFFAIITSLFFTAYTIPKKLSGQSTFRYSLFQGIGYFGGSILCYLIHALTSTDGAESFLNPLLLLSALSGVVWFSGCVFFFLAIDSMGLSRSNQWKNLQGPFGAVFNLLFLAEYANTNVIFIILSCGFILVSAMFLTIKNRAGEKFEKKGIIYALASAVLFGLNSMLMKSGTNNGLVYSQQVVLSGMVLVSAVVYLLITEHSVKCVLKIKEKDNLLGIAGGLLFAAAAFFSLQAYKLLPGSVTFTIIQLNAVWTILAGIIIFKEISFRKNWLRIVLGMVCAVVGVIMLLFA